MVVTRGKDGMSVVTKDGAPVHLRTMARQVYDVSGAGDTAIAAMSLDWRPVPISYRPRRSRSRRRNCSRQARYGSRHSIRVD